MSKKPKQKRPPPSKKAAGTSPVDRQIARALRLYKQGKLEEAARIYIEIHRKDPRNFNAPYLLGTLYLQQGVYDEAEKFLQEALRIKKHPFASNDIQMRDDSF